MMFVNLNKKNKTRKTFRRVWVLLMVMIIALGLPSIFIFIGLKSTISHGKALVAAYQEQKFDNLRKELVSTKNGLEQTNIALNFLFWLRILPFIGGYYADARGFAGAGVEELKALEKILISLEPAKLELGFDGNQKSGPERVTQVIRILQKSLPQLDEVETNFKKAKELVENIDTGKYPGILDLAKNFIIGAAVAVDEGRDALIAAPLALGDPVPKEYLLLFQNDKEIRPTGGFITAFATLKINKGQVETTTSDDIYRLDERLLATCQSKICPLTPPAPIVKYLPEVSGKPRSAWSMRDSNISPDLPTSALEFERIFKLLGSGLPFDGIIYIDSQVVEELIEVTGPIDVFGTTYSGETDKRCNCPNVIYELESYAEIAAKGEQDRKAVLGVLMQQILAKALGADVEKLPQLIETIARLANHKHIMFYMHDQNTQSALSKLNWTGEIKDFEGDYLHINDSNFAGGKSNLYVEQKVVQEITVKNNQVIKKITIEYKNPQPFGVWLNGINRDYVRFYVPKGSKLISGKGADEPFNTIEDLDKTVFETFLTIRPQNSRKIELEYEIPYFPKEKYELLIQKQPGAKDFEYVIKLNGSTKADFKLDQDKQFKFDL
ncbi:DUF4012 domain-containing protein [Candidatus Daviesbacteria bacterium]|nr:DUF4012 domain-containing protein [Candidatus Daviesbacteria bacterium]